ncbi:MAG: BadF/BadG/BcrA/BcrD ATPase family protein [Patescibacteria group bacterium]|nr:BadF/BadG/BcrA/BcrD ATPase family protein [Patescibacteria group bacterium]
MKSLTHGDQVVGLKVGKTTVAAIVLESNGSGWSLVMKLFESHQRNPREAVSRIWSRLDHPRLGMVVVTGSLRHVMGKPALSDIPRNAALERACGHFYQDPSSLNVIRISAGGYAVMARDKEGRYRHSPTERCSAGTGDAITKLCARAGYADLESALAAAELADGEIPVHSRCSAFAQTEVTHLVNEGKPKDWVLRGYLSGIAGLIYALFRKHCVDGRVVVIGGVSKNRLVMDSLQNLIGRELEIRPDSDYFEAHGAALIASDIAESRGLSLAYSADPDQVISQRERTINTFPPLNDFRHLVHQMTEPEFALASWPGGRVVLGIDSGSTGTKGALVDVTTGCRVWDDYIPTNSNPVAAAQEIVRRMLEVVGSRAVIVGLGFTGSGRQAVYSVARACFGDQLDRMLVQTEIIAHAEGARHYDPDEADSLTVCELGGQDAKVIKLRRGRIIAADMNRACSAGTGAEAGYDALRFGTNVQEFGRWALRSTHPVDIGQTCTVFSTDTIDRALSEGWTVCDAAAGRYWFIALNWLNRLVGQMGLERKIFVLGMPANNIALPLAIAAVTGREVIVPPRPGATGAVGIALLERDQACREGIVLDQSFDLRRFLEVEVVERAHFACGSRDCGAGCKIETAQIRVGHEIVRVKSGGMCPLHEGAAAGDKLPTDAPKPFHERQALWRRLASQLPTRIQGQPTVAVPMALGDVRFGPLLTFYWSSLGLNVRVIEAGAGTLLRGEDTCTGKDLCAPVKLAHGLAAEAVEQRIDFLCFPKLVILPRLNQRDIGSTCPLVQGTPQMVDAAINGVNQHGPEKIKVLAPVLKFGLNWTEDRQLEQAFIRMGRKVGKTKGECQAAFRSAIQAQLDFQRECLAIGERALRYAAEQKIPAVVVLGRLYAIHSPAINGQIPQIIQSCGVVAIPVDCYPTQDDTAFLDLVYWGEVQRILRAVVDLHNRPGVYPLMLTCYSCGPDSFTEHWLKYLADVPYCIIETDGHTGMGGFTTRIQSSVYAMQRHLRDGDRREPIQNLKALQMHDAGPVFKPGDEKSAIVLCQFGNLEPILASIFESAGIRSIPGPVTNEEILRLGRQYATGKECVPYISVTGAMEYVLKNLVPRHPELEHIYWFMPGTTGPCRFGSYRTQHGIILEALDPKRTVHMFATSSDSGYDGVFGSHLRLKGCAGVMLADLLDELWCYFLPIARDPDQVDRIHQRVMGWAVEYLRRSPAKTSWAQAWDFFQVWGLEKFIRRAIQEFQKIKLDPERSRTVVATNLAGEIYVVRDSYVNGGVVRILADHNVRVHRSRVSTWIQYLTWTQGHGHKRKQFNPWKVRIKAFLQWWIFWSLDKPVAEALNRETHTRIEPLIEKARPYFTDAPEGEAALTIAELLDGGIAVGPQGCMVSKYAEAQLHHCSSSDVVKTLYVDGDPIDRDQLAGYAWVLHESRGQGGINSLPRGSLTQTVSEVV